MKIFILNPNFKNERKSIMNVRARQPLELANIAAILRQKGHQIKLLDASVLGLSKEEIAAEIKSFSPQIFLVTTSPVDRWECPNTHLENVFKIINEVEARIKIVMGSHGTTAPEWIFKNCAADVVVRGEPELTVEKLIDVLAVGREDKTLKGISFKEKNKIINNLAAERITDLDALPLPAYDLLPMEKYSAVGLEQPFSIMMTSRGCPFGCIFCLKAMAPGKYLAQTPERTVRELEYLIKNFGVKSIYFQDWEFLILPERVEKICQLILEKGLKLSWGCNARATDIARNADLIFLMKKAGCVKINLGMESGSDKILTAIDKKVNTHDLTEAIKILRSENLETGYYVLLNCPGEDQKTLKETADFIEQNNLKVKSFNPAIPYPGTILFEKLKKERPEKEINWSNAEEYAGRVEVRIAPGLARFYLRHFKWQKKYGKIYWLKLKFWREVIFKKI